MRIDPNKTNAVLTLIGVFMENSDKAQFILDISKNPSKNLSNQEIEAVHELRTVMQGVLTLLVNEDFRWSMFMAGLQQEHPEEYMKLCEEVPEALEKATYLTQGTDNLLDTLVQDKKNKLN